MVTKVEWSGFGQMMSAYVDDRFVGLLGRYTKYWLFTLPDAAEIRLPIHLTEEEAKTVALVTWRMR